MPILRARGTHSGVVQQALRTAVLARALDSEKEVL